jgi:hypothetical protein
MHVVHLTQFININVLWKHKIRTFLTFKTDKKCCGQNTIRRTPNLVNFLHLITDAPLTHTFRALLFNPNDDIKAIYSMCRVSAGIDERHAQDGYQFQ